MAEDVSVEHFCIFPEYSARLVAFRDKAEASSATVVPAFQRLCEEWNYRADVALSKIERQRQRVADQMRTCSPPFHNEKDRLEYKWLCNTLEYLDAHRQRLMAAKKQLAEALDTLRRNTPQFIDTVDKNVEAGVKYLHITEDTITNYSNTKVQ